MPDLLSRAGIALAERHIHEALALFRQAEESGADADKCAAGRWNCYMLLGEFHHAWRESDAIERRGKPDANRFWDGGSLEGKHIILRCLHGLGDTLQFLRFAPRIKAKARSLSIEVQPVLKPLIHLANHNGRLADRILIWNDPPPLWDAQIEVNELPRILRVTMDDVSAAPRYLELPRAGARKRHHCLQAGLVWAAGDFNPARSIAPELLAPFLRLKDVEWHTLQAGEQHNELDCLDFPFVKVCHKETPILTVAQTMLNLDLIVTVDTMTAHLAGSLGCPVWTMLPFASDWRWLLDRTGSPWYPSMRLFRQDRTKSWQPVISAVCSELQIRTNMIDPQHAGKMSFEGGLAQRTG